MKKTNDFSLPELESKKRNPVKKYLTLLWRSRTATLGAVILIFLIITAVFQAQVATHDPKKQNIRDRLLPPTWFDKDVEGHILGTDQLGRDIFSRLVYGVRISLFVGISGVLISATIGTILGLISGYYGGRIGSLIMRLVDIFLAFPFLLVAIMLVVTLGPSLRNIIIILGITGWATYTRLVRGQTLLVREQEYVQAALVIGASSKRIIFKHIFPNLIAPIIIYSSLEIGLYIITESSLTFLGMGIPPSIPTWGNMLALGRDYLTNAWWLATFPGLSIVITVLAFNFLGDWLRDALDPRSTYDV